MTSNKELKELIEALREEIKELREDITNQNPRSETVPCTEWGKIISPLNYPKITFTNEKLSRGTSAIPRENQ